MKGFLNYYETFNKSLEEFVKKSFKKTIRPNQLFTKSGGKRLRPILLLMSADAFGKKHKKAIHAALAVEIFHNFTLMHDDIMDEAPLRRESLLCIKNGI